MKTSLFLLLLLLNSFAFWKGIIPQALAYSHKKKPPHCHFAGWISYLDEKGHCLPPWSAVKMSYINRERLRSFGPRYNQEYFCGEKNLFRCHPLIFGSSQESPKGYCVAVNDHQNPSMATKACLQNLDKEKIAALRENLEEDPQKFAHFLAIAAETLQFCKNDKGQNAYCHELLSFLEEQIEHALSSLHKVDFITHLADVMKFLKKMGFGEINIPLEGDKKELQLKIYRAALLEYSNSQKTQKMIRALKRNATKKCLYCEDSFDLLPPKPPWKSVDYCARYVKTAMRQGGYLKDYPNFINAEDFKPFFENRREFINLQDIEGLNITVENAPIGVITVYRHEGEPGHVEVKTGQNQFISDHVAKKPIHLKDKNKELLGIYIYLSQKVRDNLQALEEISF